MVLVSPQTLQALSRKCIIDNRTKFLNKSMCNLPNSIVQELLADVIKSVEMRASALAPVNQRDHDDVIIIEKKIFASFMLELLNKNTLHFELAKFWNDSCPEMEVSFFEHMLQNCPKIQKFELSRQLWDYYFGKMVPWIKISTAWTNLCHLKFCYHSWQIKVNSDTLLEDISSLLPNLSNLEVSLSVTSFTTKGVSHLSKIRRLSYLKICLNGVVEENTNIDVLVQAAGMVSSLELFSFKSLRCKHNISQLFVQQYGLKFPNKNLIIKKLWFNRDLECAWPANLRVQELYLGTKSFHDGQSFDCKNLLEDNHSNVQSIEIYSMPPSKLYLVVEKFGPLRLTHLNIYRNHATRYFDGALDVNRLEAACPRIQKLSIIEDE